MCIQCGISAGQLPGGHQAQGGRHNGVSRMHVIPFHGPGRLTHLCWSTPFYTWGRKQTTHCPVAWAGEMALLGGRASLPHLHLWARAPHVRVPLKDQILVDGRLQWGQRARKAGAWVQTTAFDKLQYIACKPCAPTHGLFATRGALDAPHSQWRNAAARLLRGPLLAACCCAHLLRDLQDADPVHMIADAGESGHGSQPRSLRHRLLAQPPALPQPPPLHRVCAGRCLLPRSAPHAAIAGAGTLGLRSCLER